MISLVHSGLSNITSCKYFGVIVSIYVSPPGWKGDIEDWKPLNGYYGKQALSGLETPKWVLKQIGPLRTGNPEMGTMENRPFEDWKPFNEYFGKQTL